MKPPNLGNRIARCLTCKHWKRVEGNKSSDWDYGVCPKVWVAFNPETLSKVFDPLRSDMKMKTHQQFGCNMHEKGNVKRK